MGVHGSREAPERLALQGELVEAMPLNELVFTTFDELAADGGAVCCIVLAIVLKFRQLYICITCVA